MQAGLPPRLRSMQEPAVRRISGARTPRVESLAGDWLRQDYEAHRHSAAEPGMPEPPILAKAEAAPKVGPPVVLANAKATVGAIPAQVFEALTDAAQLGAWWAEDVRVDAQMSGVYEGTLPSGRVEGTITWIEGPRKFSFEWPIVVEGASVVTSVVYELSPKGPQTVVHVSHRSSGRDGTEAHRPGLHARGRGGHDTDERSESKLVGLAIARQEHGRRTVTDPARVAGGHRAALPKHGTEFRERLEGGVGPRRLVAGEQEGPATLLGNRHGNDFFGEPTGLHRGDRPAVALQRESVLILTGDLGIQLPQVLRGLAHGVVPVLGLKSRIRKPPSQRRVPRGQVPHSAVEVLRDRVRRPRHAFDAAGHEHLAFAGLDGPRRGSDRREARRAETVESQARRGYPSPREEVRRRGDDAVVLSRLVRTAEIHFVHEGGVHARASHDLAHDERPEVIRPDVLERALVSAHRGPHSAHDHRFRHSGIPRIAPSHGRIWTSGSRRALATLSHTSPGNGEVPLAAYLYLEV